jgi:pyrimidine-nucleoside phosphorylase
MRAVDLIRQKRSGLPLTAKEIAWLIDTYSKGGIPDYQMASMAMAIYFKGLDDAELTHWTRAMLHSGDVLSFDVGRPILDKHSTGGVGDKTSLILAPVCAAAGLCVPMISGRGLGHTGGTLDKLESIPGYRVALSSEELDRVLAETSMAIVGQTAQLVPADRRLYALRDVTATVESIPLIASSIMSKKLAEGLDGLVLDVKVGSGAFMDSIEKARELSEKMVGIGRAMDVETHVLITDMDQPLGLTVGNALEVREAVETLRGEGPRDLEELVCELASEMMVIGGVESDHKSGLTKARALLRSGHAFETFKAAVIAQGGDPRVLDKTSLLPGADRVTVWESPRQGYIQGFDCKAVGLAAMALGAGRRTTEDTVDLGVGLVLHHKRGDRVERGEPLVSVHHREGQSFSETSARLAAAVEIGPEPPDAVTLVHEVIR